MSEELDALDRQAVLALGWQFEGKHISQRLRLNDMDRFSPTRNPAQAMALFEMVPSMVVCHEDPPLPPYSAYFDQELAQDHFGDTPCIAITRAFVAYAALGETQA